MVEEAGRARARTDSVWSLYLDESGRFDRADEAVCVAGVLLREAPSREADAILRGVYRRIDPIAWYPPHATDLRLPAWWVGAWALASPADRAAHPAARTIEQAAALCARASSEPALAALLARLERRSRPRHDELAAASSWLRRNHPALADALSDLARDVERRYRDVAGALLDRFGPDRCFAVAAGDDGRAPPDGPDRYLALLVPLFERVFALLRARPAERHTVWLFAATRDVHDPRLGARRLQPRDVGDRVRAAERFAFEAPTTPTDPWVRLVVASTPSYEEAVPPGVVLADFVANRSRRALATNRPWDELRAELRAEARLPFEAVPRGAPALGLRPTVAASGAPRDAVARAFATGDADGPFGPAGWRSDQARRWAEVAAAVRRGGSP